MTIFRSLTRRRPAAGFVLAHVIACAGCGLSRPYPDKSLHAITVSKPASASAPWADSKNGRAVLRVEAVRVARPFDSSGFVYKLGPSTFTTDYYNGFITPPDRLLGAGLADWLDASGTFAAVLHGSSAADYQLSLEANVKSLYGDYSQPQHPAAVIEMRVFMIDLRDGHYAVVFRKTYRETETLAGTGPDQLVDGWGTAYQRILESLVADMRQPAVAQLANLEPSR